MRKTLCLMCMILMVCMFVCRFHVVSILHIVVDYMDGAKLEYKSK